MRRFSVTLVAAGAVLVSLPATASAQVDLTGIWAPIFHEDQVERIPGPEVGDYSGLPITDAERLRAESWDASLLTLPEHQCKPHPSTYGFRGVGNLRITPVYNDATQQMVKLITHIQWQEQEREVWMDGRPHPPDFAAHTWQGFSTGEWDNNVLVVKTTHLKAGWIRRNGLALSDKATMTERFIRHGNYLTHVYIIEDPYYLSEPLIKTNGFQLTDQVTMAPYPCSPAVEVPREAGEVPHHLPGQNPFLERLREEVQDPARGHARRRRDGAARVHEEGRRPVACAGGRARDGAAHRVPGGVRRVRGRDRGGAGPAAPARWRAAARRPPCSRCTSRATSGCWSAASSTPRCRSADDGVLVVDTMTDALAEPMIAEIKRLAGDKPIRWIVNTHAHPDHTGGNAKVAAAGPLDHRRQLRRPGGAGRGQLRADHRPREHRQPAGRAMKPALPVQATPAETFFGTQHEFFFNDEAVQLIHVPNAHSDGDVMVFFRKSDVLVAGDLYVNTTFPVINTPRAAPSRACWRRSTASSTSPCRARSRRAAPSSFPATGGWPTRPTWSNTATCPRSSATGSRTRRRRSRRWRR